MPFNVDLARAFVISEDRDEARWFAGREDEIEAIEGAIANSKTRTRAVFRVIQGAPGAGKSSLLAHLAEHRTAEHRVYVPLAHRDIISFDALDAKIDLTLAKRDPPWATAARMVFQGVGRSLRAGDVSDEATRRLRDHLGDNLELVLMLDEGQAIEPDCHRTLLDLHADGIGRPCVLLVAGLPHTAEVIGSIKGLSRPARHAVINLSAMSDDERRESTRAMLTEMGAQGSAAWIEHACCEVSAMSFGWPQHLQGAQVALVEALIERDGSLTGIDYGAVRKQSDERRFDYYGKRLAYDRLLKDVAYTARLVAAIKAMNEPWTLSNMVRACRAAMAKCDLPQDLADAEPPTPTAIVRAMVEKGVFAKTDDEHHEIAIPSMADWLDARLDEPRDLPRPPPVHCNRRTDHG